MVLLQSADPVYLLGVERASSSCSSGMLGMSGYSRSCADLSSLTRGKVLSGKKELLGEVNGDNRFAHVHSVHCTHS